MPDRILRVNVFVDPDRPLFSGNPAIVVLCDGFPEESVMQRFAEDMGVTGTAFVVTRGFDHHLRLFTPRVEIDFSGHTSMASAHALAAEGLLGGESKLHCRVGVLHAQRLEAGIELTCPIDRPERASAPAGLIEALGIQPVAVVRGRFDYLVQVDSSRDVQDVRVDLDGLSRVETRGVIVTARSSDAEFDCVSRFFAPRAGIDEDPVTGSAHCLLAPFWCERTGATTLTAYQASRRGGVVRARIEGDSVHLQGTTSTVHAGDLMGSLG